MKRKIAGGIVKYRIWILIAMLICAGLSAASISRTRINYDLTRYLSGDTMTRRALTVMEEEFGSSEQVRVMFENLDEATLDGRVEALGALDEVRFAVYDPETDARQIGENTFHLVTLTLAECDEAALVRSLREMFDGEEGFAVGGSAAAQLDLQASVGAEIPEVMLISVAVVLVVLLLTSHAWLEPVVILLVLAISILINMGTNFIFPDVSFITFAVCAILQLALSIDYAIMLLHTYNRFSDEGLAAADAMTEALNQCFMRIASSAFTTVAGLLSLLFMSFTIGFDIGLALSKGIVVSMLSVFLLMPSVTLLLGKALRKTRHAPIRLGGEHLARAVYAARKPLAALLILAVLAGAYLQFGNAYSFTDVGHSHGKSESEAVDQVFGASDPLVLLIPAGDEDEDYDRQRALVHALEGIDLGGERAIGEISAMVTTGAEALRYYTVQDVADLTGLSPILIDLYFRSQGFGESVRADRLLSAAGDLAGGGQIESLQQALEMAQSAFNGPHYARMLFDLNFPASDERLRPAIDGILSAAAEIYGDDFYLTGTPMSTYDIGNAFEGDLMKVNLITFLAIFLIVAFSFRALALPAILVFVIEGAIWITMAISRIAHQPIFFMSYLICVSIQMGATIDYGILFSDQYRALLREGLAARDALAAAMKQAMPTILTSGVILITAGYIVGKRCSIYYISSIGLLLSRGALISVILVLTLLPALLSISDRLVLGRRR